MSSSLNTQLPIPLCHLRHVASPHSTAIPDPNNPKSYCIYSAPSITESLEIYHGSFIHPYDLPDVEFTLSVNVLERKARIHDTSSRQVTKVIHKGAQSSWHSLPDLTHEWVFPVDGSTTLGVGQSGGNLTVFKVDWSSEIISGIAVKSELPFCRALLPQVPDINLGYVVKIVKTSSLRPSTTTTQVIERLKWELDEISRPLSRHPCIVEILSSRNWGIPDRDVEIFMAPERGTLRTMCEDGTVVGTRTAWGKPIATLTKSLLHSMLAALDFLKSKCITHGDIRPNSILYSIADTDTPHGPIINFKLGGFGISNHINRADDKYFNFRAPEYDRTLEMLQDKADVWSLFVTLVWLGDLGDFRNTFAATSHETACVRIATIADESRQGDMVYEWRPMGTLRWQDRPSAAEMLQACKQVELLTTDEDDIPLRPMIYKRQDADDLRGLERSRTPNMSPSSSWSSRHSSPARDQRGRSPQGHTRSPSASRPMRHSSPAHEQPVSTRSPQEAGNRVLKTMPIQTKTSIHGLRDLNTLASQMGLKD